MLIMFGSSVYANPITELRAIIATLEYVQKDIEIKLKEHAELVREFTQLSGHMSVHFSEITQLLNEAEQILSQAEIEVQKKRAVSISLLNLYQEFFLHYGLIANSIEAISAFHIQRTHVIAQQIKEKIAENSQIAIGKPGEVGALLDEAKVLMRAGS